MKIISALLIFFMSCSLCTMSIHNLITLLIFDTRFILKLFTTNFVPNKFSMICSFFISLLLHTAILSGGYLISAHFNNEVFYIVPLVYTLFKGIYQGRLSKQYMLTLFFRKHDHNINQTLSFFPNYDENGIISNYKETMDYIEMLSISNYIII